MDLTFKKTYIGNYAFDSELTLKECRQYAIYHEDSLIGRLNFSFGITYFTLLRREYFIKYEHHYLKKSKHILVDVESGIQKGEFKIPDSWSPWASKGNFITENKAYKFDRVCSDVKYSLFKRNTWGHFKFKLSSEDDFITYKLNVDTPGITGNNMRVRNAIGNIESKCDSYLLSIAGIYLIERYMEARDSD